MDLYCPALITLASIAVMWGTERVGGMQRPAGALDPVCPSWLRSNQCSGWWHQLLSASTTALLILMAIDLLNAKKQHGVSKTSEMLPYHAVSWGRNRMYCLLWCLHLVDFWKQHRCLLHYLRYPIILCVQFGKQMLKEICFLMKEGFFFFFSIWFYFYRQTSIFVIK